MINTKEELFRTICNASRLGTLGYFIGAGFSKAVLEGNGRYASYSWGELLEKCCDKLKIDKSIMKSYCSYPELATKICNEYAGSNNMTYDEAVAVLKRDICSLVYSYPEREQREKYEGWFRAVPPYWIATTNYDTIIESILGGNALPISPNGCFLNIKGMIPVFHLHGMCNEPDGIIITNEDYANIFRPNDYRQARLPFLMKESCVLMMGYGLGDINVLTAVDWAKNVYTNINEQYDFPIIQLLYTSTPKNAPYIGKDNVIIYEISSIESFFLELCSFMDGYMEEYNSKNKSVAWNIQYLNNTEEDNILRFINNVDNSKTIILSFFQALEPEFGYAYNSFFPFLRVVLEKLDELSSENGAFEAYNLKLCMIMDIFLYIPLKKIPVSFFGMLANELSKVGGYVEPYGAHERGCSYSATDSWQKYKNVIPQDVVDELWRFSNSGRYLYGGLKALLNSIPAIP